MHSDNNAFTVKEIIASRDYVTKLRFALTWQKFYVENF